MSIGALLATFAGRRQFILYRLTEPDAATGKRDKVPVHPATGRDHTAHDAEAWITAEEAAGYAAVGWPVGLVIVEGCGLFCIDLDGQRLANGEWSPMALDVCARFPGAALELSTSGNGLHIFGSCAPDFPKHRVTRAGSGLEIYTRNRFIALTGTHFRGDPRGDHTAALARTIADYLPEAISGPDAEWTTGPVADWRGGGTDEQIIQTLMNRATAHAVFGAGASFADLWTANVEALQRAFPDPTGKAAYNASAADQALANHLAWATGYDCERSRGLMLRSALRREKWERDDYIRRTILTAAAGRPPLRVAAHAEAPAVAPVIALPGPAGAEAPPTPPTRSVVPVAPDSAPGGFAPGHYVTTAEQARLFEGCIYVRDVHQILMPDGGMIAQGPFNAHFGGLTFQMMADGTKPTKEAWQAFIFSEVAHFPRTDGVIFTPKLAPRELIYRDGQKLVNTWAPLYIDKQPGDVAPFLEHLRRVYPHGRDAEILLAYMAAVVQYQGEKFKWCPLLQGVEGNGKTFFSKCVEHAIGQRYTHWPRADMLGKQFNAAFYGKLLVCVEDVRISEARESLWETLKPMITGEQIEIEPKGVDSKVARDVCFNFILNSNHRNAIRKTENDRRIAPLFGAQQTRADLARDGLTDAYFIKLYSWANAGGWAKIAHYLSTCAIADDINPARGMIRAPETSSTASAIHAGRGVVEQELQEAIGEGRRGFRGGWLNSMAFDNMLAEIGKARAVSRNARRELLEGLGYRPHPGLPDGRVTLPDGSTPRLYLTAAPHVTEGAGWGPAEIVRAYLDAQTG